MSRTHGRLSLSPRSAAASDARRPGGCLRTGRRLPLYQVAAAAALIGIGCSTNPATGRREVVLMSTEREKSVGEQASKQVAAQMGVMKDSALSAYVESIGKRLAALSPRRDVQYDFHVVDLPEANAFALPGGHIYVTRGLLALTNSEDELANVIGHEIGHVAARHAAQQETRATGIGLLSTLGTIAAAVAGSGEAAQAMGQLGQLAGSGLLASYGREQEREADRIGQTLSAKAGWDPEGMGVFLRTLGKDVELRTGKKERPGFLDSHPTTPERVQGAIALARTLDPAPPAPIAASRAEYLARMEGIQIGEDPSAGLFRGATFLHPDLDLYLEFPNGWQMRNEPTAVGGISPRNGAFIKVEGDGGSGDPATAANQFLEKAGIGEARRMRVRAGEARGYQAVFSDGDKTVEMTWIPHKGQLYRMTAACPGPAYGAYRRIFERTLGSFRPLGPEERQSIKSRTLYTARASRGETITQLSARTGNAWSVEETAVANGLVPYDALAEGQYVKIAIERVYEPRAPAAPEEPAAATATATPPGTDTPPAVPAATAEPRVALP